MGYQPARALTARVTISPYALHYIETFGREFSAALGRSEFLQKIYRVPPKAPLIVPFTYGSWRVYIGGLLVNVNPQSPMHREVPLPWHFKNPRAVVTFDDPAVARQALAIDTEYRRRQLWLMRAEDGNWFARMSWHAEKDPKPRADRSKKKEETTT